MTLDFSINFEGDIVEIVNLEDFFDLSQLKNSISPKDKFHSEVESNQESEISNEDKFKKHIISILLLKKMEKFEEGI